jgi:anthranilate phosphoribosyltransferase
VKRQVVGVFSPHLQRPMAQTLRNLGSETVWVGHGCDGLDEITTTGETMVLEIRSGVVSRSTVNPEDFGLERAQPSDLRTNGLEANTAVAHEVLAGRPGPPLDIVLLNAAAGLVAADRAADFAEGISLARASIGSGAALAKLRQLVAFSNSVERVENDMKP